MRKTLVSYLLVLAMVLAFAIPALAEGEPVQLSAVVALHSSTLDLETLPIYQELEEKCNVKINWEYYRADWDTKKQLILASGDLPDIFFGSATLNGSDIELNLDSFIPLDDLIAEYAPNIQRMLEAYPEAKNLCSFSDGKMYSLPHVAPERPVHFGSMFIDQAWLDKLGLEMPTTIDELNEVARAFVTQDPNGNGEADEIGYAFDSVNGANFGARVWIGAFGIHDSLDSWLALDDDKNVIYNPAQDGYKDFVTWLRYLYEEGLVDREFLTQDFAQYKAKTRRSEMEISGIQSGWDISQMNNPNYTVLMPVVGPNGDQNVSGNTLFNKLGPGGYYAMSISTACEDPVAAIKWADQFYSDEYGLQAYYGAYGVSLIENEDGTISFTYPEGQTMDNWKWTNGMSDRFVGWVSDEMESKLVFDSEAYQNGVGKLQTDERYKPYIHEEYVYPPVVLGSEKAEEAASLYADIESITNTFTAQWIADGGVEEGWEEYKAELERAGLSRWLELYQEAYDAKYKN